MEKKSPALLTMMAKRRKIGGINSELQPDIIQLILRKLPFFNLPNCRLVCKAWNNLVLTCKFDPSISVSNLLFSYISPFCNLHCVDFNPRMNSVASFIFHPYLSSKFVRIISSCNELLCLLIMKSSQRPSAICISNPMTNEFVELPIISREAIYYYGLGFSPKTKQYKLARTRDAISDTFVEIFAFGTSHKWTPIGFFPSFYNNGHGVYFNGGLYWLGVSQEDTESAIYRLDIENEKLEQISIPEQFGGDISIGAFNGSLYFTVCITMVRKGSYHVWKMEEDYKWTKEFVLAEPEILDDFPRCCLDIEYAHASFSLQPIKAFEDGKILFLLARLLLILYDPKTDKMEKLTVQDFEFKKQMLFHQIDSFNFNSLSHILAGKC